MNLASLGYTLFLFFFKLDMIPTCYHRGSEGARLILYYPSGWSSRPDWAT